MLPVLIPYFLLFHHIGTCQADRRASVSRLNKLASPTMRSTLLCQQVTGFSSESKTAQLLATLAAYFTVSTRNFSKLCCYLYAQSLCFPRASPGHFVRIRFCFGSHRRRCDAMLLDRRANGSQVAGNDENRSSDRARIILA